MFDQVKVNTQKRKYCFVMLKKIELLKRILKEKGIYKTNGKIVER